MMMTKAEFGEDLYEAIKACSSAEHLQRMIGMAKNERERKAIQARHTVAVAEAKQVTGRLTCSDRDAARLIKRYPWVLE